ncbi:MAG: hypothetical protein ACR2L1_04295, partial [Pyrinomonadaceae bacterium]
MKLDKSPQNREIFDNAFSFYGTLSPDGFLLELTGKVFIKAMTEPELLIGHKFTETVFWHSAPHISGLLSQIIEDAANGIKSKTELDFRVTARIIQTIEFSLIPQTDDSGDVKNIFFYAIDISDKIREIRFHKDRGEHLLYAAESADVGLWFWDLAKDE